MTQAEPMGFSLGNLNWHWDRLPAGIYQRVIGCRERTLSVSIPDPEHQG